VSTWFGLLFIVLIAAVAVYSYKISGITAKPLNADAFLVEKKGSAARGKFWKAVLYSAGVGALSMWLGYIGMFGHYDSTRPTKPDASMGTVIPQNNHGHLVYLTEQEEARLLGLQRLSIGLALVGVLSMYFYKRATGKMPS
jgi:hypothetical protein